MIKRLALASVVALCTLIAAAAVIINPSRHGAYSSGGIDPAAIVMDCGGNDANPGTLASPVRMFAQAPHEAVYVRPTDNVAEIVSARPAGSTFIFASGVYKASNVIPKDGDTFIGNGEVVFNGSIPIAGWVKEDGHWSAAGFPAPGFSPGTADSGREGLAQVPEDLYVDGRPYLRVGSLAAVGGGEFYYSDGRVYISDDPTGKTTTASARAVAFSGGNTRDVTIKNINVMQYASFAQHGAIEAHGSSCWTLIDVNAVANHGVGLAGGSNMLVLGGSFSNNGEEGIEDYSAANVIINGARIRNNNYAGYSPGWDAGGIKILLSKNITIENSDVSSNMGNGLWFDTDNENVLIENNTIHDNQRLGVEYETSFNAKISSNDIGYNAKSGYITGYWGSAILLQNSQDATVSENLVISDGGEGIGMIEDTRPTGPRGLYATVNNRVENNTIVMLKPGLNGGGTDGSPVSQMFNGSNLWNHNTYIGRDADSLRFTWERKYFGVADRSNFDENGMYIFNADPVAAIPNNPVVVTKVTAFPLEEGSGGSHCVIFTLAISRTVTIDEGAPTLTLNDGGTATYVAGSGSRALMFAYAPAPRDRGLSGLAITALNLPPGTSVQDASGNAVDMAGAMTYFPELSRGHATMGIPHAADDKSKR